MKKLLAILMVAAVIFCGMSFAETDSREELNQIHYSLTLDGRELGEDYTPDVFEGDELVFTAWSDTVNVSLVGFYFNNGTEVETSKSNTMVIPVTSDCKGIISVAAAGLTEDNVLVQGSWASYKVNCCDDSNKITYSVTYQGEDINSLHFADIQEGEKLIFETDSEEILVSLVGYYFDDEVDNIQTVKADKMEIEVPDTVHKTLHVAASGLNSIDEVYQGPWKDYILDDEDRTSLLVQLDGRTMEDHSTNYTQAGATIHYEAVYPELIQTLYYAWDQEPLMMFANGATSVNIKVPDEYADGVHYLYLKAKTLDGYLSDFSAYKLITYTDSIATMEITLNDTSVNPGDTIQVKAGDVIKVTASTSKSEIERIGYYFDEYDKDKIIDAYDDELYVTIPDEIPEMVSFEAVTMMDRGTNNTYTKTGWQHVYLEKMEEAGPSNPGEKNLQLTATISSQTIGENSEQLHSSFDFDVFYFDMPIRPEVTTEADNDVRITF